MVVKRVGALSFAKVTGVLYAILGLFYGIVFAFVGMAGALVPQSQELGDLSGFAGIFGIGMLIVMPILFGILGFIMSLIGALLYNLVAALVGGIELEVG